MAEITTKLSVVGAASRESAATVTATVQITFAVAGAPAPRPLAPDSIADYDRELGPANLR